MAQIFLGTDPRSLAVDIMAKYTRAVDSDHVKITKVTPEVQKELKIASVPCMIITEGDRTFKCASPMAIFRHIAEATRLEAIFLGKSELDNNQILSYFELACNLSSEELAEVLNNDLKLRMFLVNFNITAADIFLYAHLVHHVKGLQDFEKVAQNNLFRWIDHIQHLPGIDKYAAGNDLTVSFPDENAKQPSKRELKKLAKKQAKEEGGNKNNKGKNEKKELKGKESKGKESKGAKEEKKGTEEEKKGTEEEEKKELNTTTETSSTKGSKKEKKQKQKQNPPKNNKAAPPQDDIPNISKLDIKVGKITKVWRHPDSTKLYCEEIDIGEDQPRSIASGLQEYVPIENMENAMVVVLANLKARKLAGFSSHGMVL